MARLKLGVLVSGRGSNLQALLDACARSDFPAEVSLVISNVPGAYALTRAQAAGVPTLVIDHKEFADRAGFEAALDAALRQAGIDLLCLAGFMRLLGGGFVEGWRDRVINIHPSLLPAFRGLHTHERAIAAGVRLHGCTVHFVRPELDDGPIIAQGVVPVLSGDDADGLAARVLAVEHRIYPLAVELIAAGRAVVEGDIVRIHGEGASDTRTLISPKD